MIKATILSAYVSSRTIGQGAELCRAGAVEDLRTEPAGDREGVVRVSGMITGQTSLNQYQTSFLLDEKNEQLLRFSCSCPVVREKHTICKHGVALLLEYIVQRDRTAEAAGRPENRKTAAPSAPVDTVPAPVPPDEASALLKQVTESEHQTRKKTAPDHPTDEGMRQLLFTYARKNIETAKTEKDSGRIELLPTLVYYGQLPNTAPQLEFKIGETGKRFYVLKNITDFVNDCEQMNYHEYGKNLAFRHSMNAFTEQSGAYVEFLRRVVREQMLISSEALQNIGAYYYSSFRVGRFLMLTPVELDEFMAAAGGKLTLMPEKEEKNLFTYDGILDKEPEINCAIFRREDGIQFGMDQVTCLRGEKSYYFPDPKEKVIYRTDRKTMGPLLPLLNAMKDRQSPHTFIANDDLPAFCRDLLPVIRKSFQVTMDDFVPEEYLPPKPDYEIYLDMPEDDMITCHLSARYGEEIYNVFGGVRISDRRDTIDEQQMDAFVRSWFNAFDPEKKEMVLSGDEEMLYRLLAEGIPSMQERAQVFVTDRLKRLKAPAVPKIRLGVSIHHDLLELSIGTEQMDLKELSEILSRYDPKKHYYRLKSGEFVTLSDDSFASFADLAGTMHLTPEQIAKGEAELPKYRALYLDALGRESDGAAVTRDRDFKALIRTMHTVEDSDYEIPEHLEDVMRDYQKTGYRWLRTLEANGFGGILADDMGLGKTLQVLALLSSRTENRMSLIVCPASLVYNWQSEIDRFTPEISVKVIAGTQSERQALIQSAGSMDVLVTSYDLLKRDISCYSSMIFACEVIDEAQFIKNANTQAAQAVKQIRAGFRLALTGTPVENRLSELWSIFDYLMPGFLYTYPRFRKELEVPVNNGEEAAAGRLKKMISPFVLRRLKRDVLKDLPEKIEEVVYAPLEGEQKELYDAHINRLKLMLAKQSDEEFKHSRILILSELTKLRELCCNPGLLYDNYKANSAKEDLCLDLISGAIDAGHKVLLFSQFTSMLDALLVRFEQAGIRTHLLTGATPKKERTDMTAAFQTDDVPVFAISLRAGGTGLNLTAADLVIHYDPWWNIAVQNQATDRAHRIGQKNVVTVYKLILKGTIEEKILKMQEQKKELADQILSGEELANPTFSREELLAIL